MTMPTLVDCSVEEGYLRVPKVQRAAVRLLWHADYWDGPKSGLVVYQGEQCWIEVVAESDTESWYRRFVIIRLSPEQLAEELRWHQLFQKCVGRHTDYDESGERQVGAVQPLELHREFYDQYEHRKRRDFSRNSILAWFEGI
jgi:hypothetical protein